MRRNLIESGNIPNGLYLLGDSEALVQINEEKLCREWFEINGLRLNETNPGKCLYIHPGKDYLRKASYRKVPASWLI